LRRAYPVLHRARFLTGDWNQELGVRDATWVTPAGEEMKPENWSDPNARCVGLILDGSGPVTGIVRRGSDATLMLIFNAHHDVVPFKLPRVAGGRSWLKLIDSNEPDGNQDEEGVRARFGYVHQAAGRSVVVFRLVVDRSRRPRARAK
jgi:isoamylase